jgi:hypothetical protein
LKFTYKIRLAGRRFLLRRLPPCDQLTPVMSDSLDRALPLHGWLILKMHLFVCMRCTRYLKQLKLMRATIRAKSSKLLAEEPAANTLSAAARERIKRALDSQKNK